MKVLHVTPSYYPAIQFGGPIQSVRLLNIGLKKREIDVQVLTTNAGLTSNTEIPTDKPIYVDDILVHYCSFIGYEHYNFSPQLFFKAFRIIPNFDIIHITAVWNFPVVATALACLWHKKPFIVSPRGTIYPETIAHKSTILKKIYFKLLGWIPVKKANMLHFTTENEAISVRKYLKLRNNYCIIPNGLDLQKIESEINNISQHNFILPEKYILFLGRIDRKKGLDLLIPAFSEVIKHVPELKLVIAGPDNNGYAKIISQISETYNIKDNIIFTGSLEGSLKWYAYKNATAFILTSYSENFGMTVAEAMYCKCPVLISEKVAIMEFLEPFNAGWICKMTQESIIKTILDMLKNSNERKLRVENAFYVVNQKFGIDTIANQMKDTYKNIIKLYHG